MAGDAWSQRSSLPIFSAREALIREFKQIDISVVVGETGSGKTTQIPQYLLESGLNKGLAIACTQPRRVAAISVAKRVALERGSELGQEIGYSVRFDDCSTAQTSLRYMTDGMLLREAIADPLLLRYSVVILDEAHERTVHTDLLFGVCKSAQTHRREQTKKKLKIIVMSATLAADAFSRYFNNAKVLYIQGRQYPVTVYYTAQAQSDYVHSAVTTVLQVHEKEETGDILLFLTGREEIESVQRVLQRCRGLFPPDWRDLEVCPLYAALPTHEQQKVFQETQEGCRKVILSTNIAETSITIPGVKYVIDTGMVKARAYNPHIAVEMLCVQPVSKAQARQRCGRAGREGPGVCYRLYTEQSFEELAEHTVPELQRCNLTGVVLELLALGLNNILSFDFMDPPSKEALVDALEQLYLLGAVQEEGGLQLTPIGKQMAHYPLEPHLSKAILASQTFNCTEEVLAIVALLSVDTVFFTPHDHKEKAVGCWQKFRSPDGDHLTLLNVYKAYQSVKGNKHWCMENFIHIRNMKAALDVQAQLHDLCTQLSIPVTSSPIADSILHSLLSGLFTNIAEHAGEGKYHTLATHQEVFIHPSSSLFDRRPRPQYVLYSELVHTNKCYIRNVSSMEQDWLSEVVPSYFKKKDTNSISNNS